MNGKMSLEDSPNLESPHWFNLELNPAQMCPSTLPFAIPSK